MSALTCAHCKYRQARRQEAVPRTLSASPTAACVPIRAKKPRRAPCTCGLCRYVSRVWGPEWPKCMVGRRDLDQSTLRFPLAHLFVRLRVTLAQLLQRGQPVPWSQPPRHPRRLVWVRTPAAARSTSQQTATQSARQQIVQLDAQAVPRLHISVLAEGQRQARDSLRTQQTQLLSAA